MQSRELGRHQRGKETCRVASEIDCKHCVNRVFVYSSCRDLIT